MESNFKETKREMDEYLRFDIKRKVREIIQETIKIEFGRHIGAQPYQRTRQRCGYRNGYYKRSLMTVYGIINDLSIPRDREGGFKPTVFKRYQRREKQLDDFIKECYLRGVSTRDISYIMKALNGQHISGEVVSKITASWQQEAVIWHNRPLDDGYEYLFFDGVCFKHRMMGKAVKRVVLVAYGIKVDGTKEIIDWRLSSKGESEEQWMRFLSHLFSRGLEGKNCKLIITDGCKGLRNAIDIVYPSIPVQLCWAHKMRNILKNVKKRDHDRVHKQLKDIFSESVTTRAEVEHIIEQWCKKWINIYPKAVNCLRRDLDELLVYLDFPSEHHRAIRTTNHIERQFKELRRRLRPMEILPNRNSMERILYALTQVRNEKLKSVPLKFTQKYLH